MAGCKIEYGQRYDAYLRSYLLMPSDPSYRVIPNILKRYTDEVPVEYLLKKLSDVYEKYADMPVMRICAMAAWYLNFLVEWEDDVHDRYERTVKEFVCAKFGNQFGTPQRCWQVFDDVSSLMCEAPKTACLQMPLAQFVHEVDNMLRFFKDPDMISLYGFWSSFRMENAARRNGLELIEYIL